MIYYDLIEITDVTTGESKALCTASSSIVPPVGALIDINGAKWRVERVTYVVEEVSGGPRRAMTVRIEVKLYAQGVPA